VPRRIVDLVDLVEDQKGVFFFNADFAEDVVDRFDLVESDRAAGVSDVDKQVGLAGFF
jgi:hypothetical protein